MLLRAGAQEDAAEIERASKFSECAGVIDAQGLLAQYATAGDPMAKTIFWLLASIVSVMSRLMLVLRGIQILFAMVILLAAAIIAWRLIWLSNRGIVG